jgi:hypothetical protein
MNFIKVTPIILLVGISFVSNSATKPNVILVLTDDQGYGEIAAHGNKIIKTPNLDLLSQQSVRLTDFHVAPKCAPTRAALMTGVYPRRAGVWHTVAGVSLMRPELPTMAEVFSNSGYRTAMFGKWHLGESYPLRPQDRGFDEVFWHKGGGVGQTPDHVAFLTLLEVMGFLLLWVLSSYPNQSLWSDQCTSISTVRNIFLYLDRTYVISSGVCRSIWDMGLQVCHSVHSL